MSNYSATVIKTGNSYALRVSKEYVNKAKLQLGQKVSLPLPATNIIQDQERIQSILHKLQELEAYKDVQDPSAWQREIRTDRPLPGR